MKTYKQLFLAFVALCYSLTASAQEPYNDYYAKQEKKPRSRVEWGFSAGGGAWIYDTTVELYDVEGSFGWQAGLQWAIVWDKIGIEADIRYARHRVTLTPRGEAYETVKIPANAVDVPVMVSFRPGIFRINFGPVFHVLNSSKHTMPDGTYFDLGCIRPTVGFTVGVGVKLGRHWLVDARYNGDFSAAEGVFYNDGPEVSIRQHAVQLSIGFLL